jgi:hypothetical protein
MPHPSIPALDSSKKRKLYLTDPSEKSGHFQVLRLFGMTKKKE